MRTQSLLPLIPLVALNALPAMAAGSGLLDMLGPDTAVVAGIDFEKVRVSPFGKYVLSTMNVSQSDLEKFTQLTGFDPMKDLREVIVASPNADLKGDGLILVRGTFDQSKLTGLAGLQGASIDSYLGFRLVSPPRGQNAKHPQMTAALLPEGLAIGPEASVKSALDRLSKGQTAGKELEARVNQAMSQHDAWVVTRVSPAKFAPQMRNRRAPSAAGGAGIDKLLNGNLFQGIEDFAAGLKFGANVILSGEATARSDQDATALGDVMKFLSNMVTSNAPAEAPPALLTMLGTLQTSAEGRMFRFTMSAPQTDFERMMKERAPVRARPAVHVK